MEEQERQNFGNLFISQIRRPEADLELDKAALYLAGEEYPGLNVEAYLQQLDDLAGEVRDTSSADADPQSVVSALNQHMFDHLGFAGSTDHYYNAENSFLNRVLDTRTGIPITLSVVYLELGRRLGIQCYGVGLPGHFLVRLEDLDLYLDPFNKGRLVSVADCRRMVRDAIEPNLAWREEYLAPYSKKDILYRLLNNLKSIYLGAGDYPRATEVLKKMVILSPASPQVNLALFWCYTNAHNRSAAIGHLERYLRATWPSPGESEMQRQIESLWSAISQLTQQSG